jgi:asparagine synthase (glutamine-hydrolysing)
MCGILGVAGRAAGLSNETLLAALDLLHHRGPDGGALWRFDGIALGHRRLAIVDLDARASQPMTRGAFTLVFNGEIYNYRELRRALEGQGKVFVTTSDTEVLAAAWEQWGRGCLERIEGMFAFAIWDAASEELTLVRDRFGEKPLFWLRQPEGLMFASEVPPLVRLTRGALVEDAVAIGLYFQFSYIPAPRGAFRDVQQLEPGSWLRWRAGEGFQTGRYFRMREGTVATTNLDYPTAMAELRTRLTEAVRQRIETADVPVASLLSGGLDSSIVTTIAAQVYVQPLTVYSLSFPEEPEFDESEHARAVAARLQRIRHRVIPATQRAILDFSGQVFDKLGEPFADASLLPTAFLCEQIEEKVALGGDAADELFGGYGIYPAIVRGAELPAVLRRVLTSVRPHGNPHAITSPRLRAAALFHRHLRNDTVDSYLSWRSYADVATLQRLGIAVSDGEEVREQIGGVGSGKLRDIQQVDLAFNLSV